MFREIYRCIPCLFKQSDDKSVGENCKNITSRFASDKILYDECNYFKCMSSTEVSPNKMLHIFYKNK